ncbi:MAG: hypothetical protein ACLGI3_01735 [Actinomycetes bacterium]
MTSTASTAAWLPAALARAAVVTQEAPAVHPGRHAAAEASGRVETGTPEQRRLARHAEPAWRRELFDPARDEDPFDWLGFRD